MIDLKLLIAEECEHCAEAKLKVNKAVEGLEDQVKVETLNLSHNLPQALHYKAAATPSVVINDKLEFIGQVDENELRKRLMELA